MGNENLHNTQSFWNIYFIFFRNINTFVHDKYIFINIYINVYCSICLYNAHAHIYIGINIFSTRREQFYRTVLWAMKTCMKQCMHNSQTGKTEVKRKPKRLKYTWAVQETGGSRRHGVSVKAAPWNPSNISALSYPEEPSSCPPLCRESLKHPRWIEPKLFMLRVFDSFCKLYDTMNIMLKPCMEHPAGTIHGILFTLRIITSLWG